MSHLHILLLITVASCCYGKPTKEEVHSAVERARLQNNRQKRDLAGGRSASSCPYMTSHAHGQRYSRDIYNPDDNTANEIFAAVRNLIEVGHSPEDLQHVDVRRAIQEHSTNCPSAQPTCTSPAINRYRTTDGSCNNVANPSWGQAGRPQARLAPAAYEDSVSTPRSKSVKGGDLPNPRTVSNNVHAAPEKEKPSATLKSKKNTLHIMQFGQFLDHDLILTPEQHVDPNYCCSEEGKADVDTCLPIIVPENDPRFVDGYCMNFPRSSPMVCPMQSLVRQQMNAITSFIDASNVYGSSEEETNALRMKNGAGDFTAIMRTEEGNRLPDNEDQTVCKSNATAGIACSFAGDERVNEQPALTTYHTLFVREHNRIAKTLERDFPDHETLFQETRRILIAVIQKIVYDEFLPSFLSPAAMKKYKLASTNPYTYNPGLNPTILNEFGIGYRMGHSWIPPTMDLYRKDFKPYKQFKLETTYFDPYLTYITPDPSVRGSVNGMEGMAYYLSSVFSPKVDRIVDDAARNELFVDDGGNAFDLVARNIQRERDHGVKPYHYYRKMCGLGELPKEWRDIKLSGRNTHKKKVIELLQSVYASPLDVDLFSGALSEEPEKSGEVGPTLACILGEQFKRLKYADRFWFQNNVGLENGFTKEQQDEIQKASMARLLCDNMGFMWVHRNAFIKKNKVFCSQIPEMDLSKFAPAAVAEDDEANRIENQSGGASEGNSQSDSAKDGGNSRASNGNGNRQNRRPVMFN